MNPMNTKARILIIDDEEVVLDSCTQILAGGPYELATAPDGTSGLNLVKEFKPDLVFVDLKMPGISGFEVLEKIAEIDSTIVSIVITGFATVNSAIDAMKKGAYDFLPKPFTPDEFRLITRRGLEKRRLTLETIALRREKEMLREHFAHIVSHELKAPLSAVQQNLFALEFELNGVLNPAQKEKMARIKARLDDLMQLVNTWLRTISFETDKLKETFSPVSVKGVIDKAVEIIQPYATRKDIEILVSLNELLPPVLGNSLTLSEALVNILGNAVKYSHDGSKVIVKAQENGNDILISVQDFGIGISTEDLPHIFNGFYRGQAGQQQVNSHGIGLTISRQVIEAHNGSISVESEVGKGTTFLVRLPKLAS